MGEFLGFLKRVFTPREWVLVESRTASIKQVMASELVNQRFVYYNIEYCPQLNIYRLRTLGDSAKDHPIYGEMLKRLAEYNMGTELLGEIEDLYKDYTTEDPNDVILVTIPLDNKAEEVFKMSSDSKELVEAINLHKEKLKKDGVAIFEQNNNIIVTDLGYFAALWKKDVKITPMEDLDNNKEDNEDKDEE